MKIKIKRNIFKEKKIELKKPGLFKHKVKKVMELWTLDLIKTKVGLAENQEEVKVEVVKIML